MLRTEPGTQCLPLLAHCYYCSPPLLLLKLYLNVSVRSTRRQNTQTTKTPVLSLPYFVSLYWQNTRKRRRVSPLLQTSLTSQPITLLYGFHSAPAQPLTELAVHKVTNDCLERHKSKCRPVRASRALKAVVTPSFLR